MITKAADQKKLEELYGQAGSRLIVLYGRRDCRKEELLKNFVQDKEYFYYRCRQASAEEQIRMMGEEISRRYEVPLQKKTYDSYFSRIAGSDSGKPVVIIDEAQYVMKKDAEFIKSIVRLRMKRLGPGPVFIVLASSSIVWVEQDMKELMKEDVKRIDSYMKIEDLDFLEVVRTFPQLPVNECVRIYGALGGVQGYMELWNPQVSFQDNICRLALAEDGPLFDAAQSLISAELRELSVYNTILSAIARGQNKLNELFLSTGYSRAKISVYMKNLSHFDIVEKAVSFETGGWENVKKGVYQIRDTFVNFWFKFVFPHLSDLYLMKPALFYERYIERELDGYMNRYFRNVCMEYLMLLGREGRTPFPIHKMGTWIGKSGNLDIIAQSADRQNIVGFCNWDKPQMTMKMYEAMAVHLSQAKITPEHFFLFSATEFEPALQEYARQDSRFTLIDMKEL